MEEEILEVSPPQKKKDGKTLLLRIMRYVIIALVLFMVLFGFWKISNLIYTKIIAKPTAENGTLDVYAKVKKVEPYTTFDLGKVSKEIISPATGEVVGFITMHLIFAFNEKYTLLKDELTQRTLQIKDIINSTLAQKTYEDLNSGAGQNKLIIELESSINNILENGKLADIYLDEISIMPR